MSHAPEGQEEDGLLQAFRAGPAVQPLAADQEAPQSRVKAAAARIAIELAASRWPSTPKAERSQCRSL